MHKRLAWSSTVCIVCLVLSTQLLFGNPQTRLEWKMLHNKVAQTIIDKNTDPSPFPPQHVKALLDLYYYNNAEAQNGLLSMRTNNNYGLSAEWALAEIDARSHNYKTARNDLEALLREHPEFSPARASLGFMDYSLGNFDTAMQQAENILEGEHTDDVISQTAAHLLFAACLGIKIYNASYAKKIIHGPRVLYHIAKAHHLIPNSPNVLFAEGVCYMLAPKFIFGSDTKAYELIERSIKERPRFADAYVRLAQLERRKNNPKKEQALLDKAKTLDPHNELLKDYLSRTNIFLTNF